MSIFPLPLKQLGSNIIIDDLVLIVSRRLFKLQNLVFKAGNYN